jgi:hypothetical protein
MCQFCRRQESDRRFIGSSGIGGFWILDFGFWIGDWRLTIFGLSILNLEFWILEFALEISRLRSANGDCQLGILHIPF